MRRCSRPARARAERARAEPAGMSNGRRVSLGKLPLMPVRIGGRHVAGNVQSLHLICRQTPTDGPQILLQLLLVSGTDDHGRYRRTLKQPVQGDLRHALARLGGDLVNGVDDPIEIILACRGSEFGCLGVPSFLVQ